MRFNKSRVKKNDTGNMNGGSVRFRQTYETSPVKNSHNTNNTNNNTNNSEYLSLLPSFKATCAVSYHAHIGRSGKYQTKLFK